MVNIYEAQRINKSKSALIIAFFCVFVFIAIYFIASASSIYLGTEPGGFGLVGMALIISGISAFGGYYLSDKIVLSISGARPADRKIDFNFYTVAENLAIATGLPQPKLYVINDESPNAFATGRDPNHAVICATKGLLTKLNRTELEGVIAHELSHVKNYDTRLMSLVAVMVGLVVLLGDWFLRIGIRGRRRSDNEENNLGVVILILGFIFALISPIIAKLIQLAISRRREFVADADSVKITRQPQGLISALIKISNDPNLLEVANNATAHLFIVNPLKKNIGRTGNWLSGLFNTHPPIQERIKILKNMA